MELAVEHLTVADLAALSISSVEPLIEYFPPNMKIYEFNASQNKILKEVRLGDVSEWLRLKENGSFVFQCLLCKQEMTFATAFRRGNYHLNRSHLLTRKHKNKVENNAELVGLLFNSQKFVICLARELEVSNVFEFMERVARREEAILRANLLDKVFCESFAMYSFDRKTNKLIDLDRKGDLVLFMRAEVRPLFSMYCLFCNMKASTYTQVIQHLMSGKHMRKVGIEKCAIIAVKEFNIFITCSLNKLSSFVYLTHLNSFLEEIVVAAQGSIIISGFHSVDDKPAPRKDVGIAVEVVPISLPDGSTREESVRIQTCFHNFIEEPEAMDSRALARSSKTPQKNVTIYEFSEKSFEEHYADNMLYSLLSSGTRIWCSRCSLGIYTVEDMANHLASQRHSSNIRNNEQIGFMCHHCNIFYIELKGESLSHIHSSKKNKDIIASLLETRKLAVTYESLLAKNLMRAYGELFENLGEACKYSCLLCADLSKKKLMFLEKHESEERHRVRKDTTTSFAFCSNCNVIYIHEDRGSHYFFKEHFATHLNTTSTITFKVFTLDGQPPSDITIDRCVLSDQQNINRSIPNGNISTIKIKMSKYVSQLVHPGVCSEEFENYKDCTRDILSGFISAPIVPNKFHCLDCSKYFMLMHEFVNHVFTAHSGSFFIKYCDICSELSFSFSINSLRGHFKGSHHMNKLLDLAGLCLRSGVVKEGILLEASQLFCSKGHVDRRAVQLVAETKRTYSRHRQIFQQIAAHLTQLLASLANLNIELFGSQVSRLATTSSDFDICLGVGVENLPRVKQLLENGSGRGKFTVLKSLPNATVPIIKIVHTETQAQCDISFSKGNFETHSSRLIKLYIELEERVEWLVCTVREWCRLTGLWSTEAFPSPVVTWLVLFYLMQPDIRLVPAVSLVLTHIGGIHNLLNSDLRLNSNLKDRCGMSKFELIEGFFHYYSLMKFSENKLCPLSGLVVPRAADSVGMLIEEPLSSNNVAERVTPQLAATFQLIAYQTLHMEWRTTS